MTLIILAIVLGIELSKSNRGPDPVPDPVPTSDYDGDDETVPKFIDKSHIDL